MEGIGLWIVVLMVITTLVFIVEAERALSRLAKAADDYVKSYERVLLTVSEVIHEISKRAEELKKSSPARAPNGRFVKRGQS